MPPTCLTLRLSCGPRGALVAPGQDPRHRQARSVNRRSRQLQAIVREQTILRSDTMIAFKIYCLATIRFGFIASLQNRASVYCLSTTRPIRFGFIASFQNRASMYCLAHHKTWYYCLAHNSNWIYCLSNRSLEYIALTHHDLDHYAFMGSEKLPP